MGEAKFTFDLKMYSSARRLKKEGTLRIAWRYTINYFWTIFGKTPYTAEYTDIREKTDVKVAVEKGIRFEVRGSGCGGGGEGKIGRSGCAYTLAYGSAEASCGRGVYGTAKAVPLSKTWRRIWPG